MLFESVTSDGNFKISIGESRIKGLYSATITRNAPRSYGSTPSKLDLIWSKFELGATPVQALRNVFREHYIWMQWQHGIIENPYPLD